MLEQILYVAFKNFAPVSTCKTETNDVFVDIADHFYITMSMYNLIEYTNNYSDSFVTVQKR